MKAIEQYFRMVLFTMLYKVVVAFISVNKLKPCLGLFKLKPFPSVSMKCFLFFDLLKTRIRIFPFFLKSVFFILLTSPIPLFLQTLHRPLVDISVDTLETSPSCIKSRK